VLCLQSREEERRRMAFEPRILKRQVLSIFGERVYSGKEER
jgi:hypothetical protein